MCCPVDQENFLDLGMLLLDFGDLAKSERKKSSFANPAIRQGAHFYAPGP